MSDANVRFHRFDSLDAPEGREQTFSFACPMHAGRRCEGLVIRGRTDLEHDPQGQNGGVAQWEWDGKRELPTFSPSINCGGCWHGYLRAGRCVSTNGTDEPEPKQ